MNLARRLLALAPAWVLAATLVAFPSLPAFLLIVGTAAISLWNPAEGILLVAGLAPLGTLLATQLDIPFRVTEAIVLAFLAGWLLDGRHRVMGPRMPRTAEVAGWWFAAIVLASAATLGLALAHTGEWPPTGRLLVWRYLWSYDRIGAQAAASLIEALALVAATVALVRQRPVLAVRLPIALAASAAVAAGASALLWTRWAPAEILDQYGQIGYRVVAQVADVNAAGSFFALMLCVAAGVLVRTSRSGRARMATESAFWTVATVAAALGLWLSASRSALWTIIVIVPLTIGWLALRRWPARRRVALVAALGVALLVAGVARARLLERDPSYRGAGMRTQFAEASVRMIAERPVFGVGIGRYYPTSRLFLAPQLAWVYGFENAHNYFLQIAAETGIAGGMLFVLFVGGIVWRGWAGVRVAPGDYRLVGCVAGVIAFLGTCLTGHPLLVPEVAVPFWIVAGLACALGESNVLRRRAAIEPARSWPVVLVVAAGCVAIAATVPWRAERPRLTPPRSFAVTGLYPAQFGGDGSVLQWSAEYGSVFVPETARAVELPLRASPGSIGAGPVPVEISTGPFGKSTVLVLDYWSYPLIDLTGTPATGGLKRIDFKSDRVVTLEGRKIGVAVQPPRPFPR